MAKRKSVGAGTEGKSNSHYKPHYVNINLSSSDKERLQEAAHSNEYPLSLLLRLVEEGYKFSIREDTRNNCFIAALTDGREDASTYRYCLTGRGATTINAWLSLAYRHFVLLDCDWSTEITSDGVSDFD